MSKGRVFNSPPAIPPGPKKEDLLKKTVEPGPRTADLKILGNIVKVDQFLYLRLRHWATN